MSDEPIILSITAGPRKGERVKVERELTIGRAPDADVVIDDDEISRRHVRVVPTPAGLEVEDLGSTNGTELDGQRLSKRTLAGDGSVISFGSTSAKVELPAEVGATSIGRTQLRTGPPPMGHAADHSQDAPPAAAAGGRDPVAALPPLPPQVARTATPLALGEGRERRRNVLYGLGLALLGAAIGVAITLAVESSSSSANKSAASAAKVEGVYSPTSIACVGDDNGKPGPGHFRFITSACENAARTIATFPLHRGISGGKTVYYVITDDSNQAEALAKGVNFVPKLKNAIGSPAVQKVTIENGIIHFPATVDFDHKRVLIPSASGFPPLKAEPPAVADPGYSPLVELPDGTVMNAEQVINSTGQAAKVVAVNYAKMTVSYKETEGRYEGKHVHYASFDSGMPVPATIEDVTYTPDLNLVPKEGDEELNSSARERLIAFINGPTDTAAFPENPERQGENSTALGEGDPRNMLQEAPVLPDHQDVGDIHYAPMWDVHFAEWTPRAIAAGDRALMKSTEDIEERLAGGARACEQGPEPCKKGLITGPEGKPFGPSGFVVNCPLISIDLP